MQNFDFSFYAKQPHLGYPKLHIRWLIMLASCYDQSHSLYQENTSVCPEWLQFEAFKGWALSTGYQTHRDESLVLSTEHNEFNKENCRWRLRKNMS